jgi:cell fate regulator YaaT (PSP1 superfamily)
MPLVVGISFKKAGKVYYFDPTGHNLREGDFVIAETARGIEFGEVLIEPREVPDEEIIPPLKKVVRKASHGDMEREEANRQKEKNAYHVCHQKILQHNLPMKLIDAEYCFDGSQVTFYFSAEARVDFRELVKDLASSLRAKVQLHQVGVRDEAKIFGGMGPCGRGMCCATFLSGFEPVSMKMAKEQSLFLNPLKFSGICGKLMCCLKFEYAMYRELKSGLPSPGSTVMTAGGPGRVTDVNVMREMLCVELEDGSSVSCSIDDLIRCGSECPSVEHTCSGCRTPEPPEPASASAEISEQPPEQPADQQSDAKSNGRRSNRRRRRSRSRKKPAQSPDGEAKPTAGPDTPAPKGTESQS